MQRIGMGVVGTQQTKLYPRESLVATGKASDQNFSCFPIKVLPFSVGTAKPLN